jgi:transposase
MSGITMAGQLATHVRRRALDSADSVAFLFRLFCRLGRLLVVWDRSPIHRGEVTDFLANGAAHHIHLELLPPYAPDLNPDEGVWQQLKHVELRNVCCADLVELCHVLRLATQRLRAKPHLIQSFFAEAGLPTKN